MARRRRSLHFVPGGNDRMLAKALTLPADGLILDLEDAVAPDRKAATRGVVSEWLGRKDFGGRERWVRMNPIATGLGQADIEPAGVDQRVGVLGQQPIRHRMPREEDGVGVVPLRVRVLPPAVSNDQDDRALRRAGHEFLSQNQRRT